MAEIDDLQLLEDYVARNSQEAFAELVRRYVNLVYSVAWRQLNNADQAQDVTQAVFLILAQKAAKLPKATVLSGWLYQTARLTSSTFIRGEMRRQRREQEAYMQSMIDEPSSEPAWEQLSPLLEEAMARLGDKERDAVVLRFFEGKSFAEAATALRLNESAAKKRVGRAVEKLRSFFLKRGVPLSAVALTGAIGTHSVQAAPAGLAATISATTAVKGAVVSASTLTLIKTTIKIMAWTKAKTAVAVGAAILIAGGTTLVAIKVVKSVIAARENEALSGIKGDWEGIAKAGAVTTRVVVKIAKTNGLYVGTLDSVDQGAKDLPASNLRYDKPKVHFEIPAAGLIYDGTLDAATGEMKGTYKQGTYTFPLDLKQTATPSSVTQLEPADLNQRKDSDLQGFWKGTLKVGKMSLRLNFKLTQQPDGTVAGVVQSVDQGSSDLPVSTATYQKPDVHLEFSGIGGTFDGKVSGDDAEIAGTWRQGGQNFPLTIKRADPEAETAVQTVNYDHTGENDLPGHWAGTLAVKGTKLRLVLHIGKLPDGTLACAMDSLDQGAKGLPASAVKFTAPNVQLEWAGIGGTYKGKLQDGKLTGTWSQGGGKMPLVFARTK